MAFALATIMSWNWTVVCPRFRQVSGCMGYSGDSSSHRDASSRRRRREPSRAFQTRTHSRYARKDEAAIRAGYTLPQPNANAQYILVTRAETTLVLSSVMQIAMEASMIHLGGNKVSVISELDDIDALVRRYS
jgi:hypothetical protein